MNIETGVDLEALLAIATDVAAIDDAPVGGRVRQALAARSCLKREI
ncbi:MAG: hypothetical protein QHC40_11625 [Sphingobium sp.]|nr:hypothetical protein [Sphingobium sp.]